MNPAEAQTLPNQEAVKSDREISREISGVEEIWDLIKKGTRTIPLERNGWVKAGPELGNLGGAPELKYVGGRFSFKAPLTYSETGQSFYSAKPEKPLQKILGPAGFEVEGVNIYRPEGGKRVRIAYKDPSSDFFYESVPVGSAEELAHHLELAAKLYQATATACFESINVPVIGDTLIIRPDEMKQLVEEISEIRPLEINPIESMLLPQKPDVVFEDIGGQDRAVASCRRFAEQLRYPTVFKLEGSLPPRGKLLWGPPGTGKTLLAKAIANEADAHFIHVKATDVVGFGFVSQAERATQAIFDGAEKLTKKDGKHVIIYVDEGELLLPSNAVMRHETTGSRVGIFAQAMDGIASSRKITVIISTNNPSDIDPRILSRMDEMEEVPLPSADGLRQILKIHLDKLVKRAGRNMVGDVDLTQIAERGFGQGLSGRDIADALGILSRERGLRQLKKIRDAISQGLLVIGQDENETDFINRLARQIAENPASAPPDVILPPIQTADLTTIVDNSKTLLKTKKKAKLGFTEP